jgi:hypothetical protein
MQRTAIALAIGLPGFVAYVVGVVTLADRVFALHWAVQAAYFLVAGVLWALPAYWLIVWAARK